MAARINHIALVARDPQGLASFYCELLQTSVLHENFKDGRLYSIWLALADQGVLMIEAMTQATGDSRQCANDSAIVSQTTKADSGRDGMAPVSAQSNTQPSQSAVPNFFHHRAPGWHLLAFDLQPADLEHGRHYLESKQINIVDQSKFSLYFYDPEGNRVALSCFQALDYLRAL